MLRLRRSPLARRALRWSSAALLCGAAGFAGALLAPLLDDLPDVGPVGSRPAVTERPTVAAVRAPARVEIKEKAEPSAKPVAPVVPWGKAIVDREAADILEAARAERAKHDAELVGLASAPPNDPARAFDDLRAAVDSGGVPVEAMGALVALRTPDGADFLYDVWTSEKDRTATTRLAEALVYSKEVREVASEALLVATDLRAENDCHAVRGILERAVRAGDERSLAAMTKLQLGSPCEDRYDCFECLRGDSLLLRAARAARTRPAPVVGRR